LRARQVVDKLSAASRTFMAFLKLFLYHVFDFCAATHALAARRLRTSYRSSTFVHHSLHVVVALNRARSALADISELLLVG
jgi:hypothetical protein